MDCDRNEKKRKRSPSPSAAENTSSASASASASASTSASASALVGEYEVFLSFCGKDTRQTFTDFLYTCLVSARIRTFKDDNELPVGEKISSELPKAIKESQISIPILSPNYASSKWCLIELAQMVKCHETMDQEIFPIFFDVEPSDVQHQRGIYDQAFRQHEKHVDEKTVQEWKDALKKVGELKGLELKKETNGLQGELASRVTSHVLLKLKKNYLIDVPEEFFGMDGHVDEMMSRLDVGSSDVRIVGIAGMGGIGKTTIARYIFNQLSERFKEGCSFIADIRERSNRHDLVKLQKELCSDILKEKDEIYNVDEGLKKIKRGVGTKKVLIVLDDVDTFNQFDKLAGKCEWFASGSRIIVTTREKHVLNRIPVDSIYEPPPMESNNSLQLFSKHAFRRDSPPKEYDSLSSDFVNVAAGLPLALEVIGSYLCDKEKSNWPAILHMFKEILPEDVQKKLKISYDALPKWQQEIFLDIACFFIGEDKRIASYLWDVRKARPAVVAIEELVLKCLVKIRHGNIIWMHDQLRDLGRSIVLNENFEEPWQRSRVWSHEDASKTMETCKETQEHEAVNVEAFKVQADSVESYPPFPTEFGQLKRLRYLEVEYGQLARYFLDKQVFAGDAYVGDFKHYFPKLRWLKWHELLARYKVTNFHLEKLVILDLSRSNFRDNSEWWNQIKMAKNLKVLNLTCCFGFNQVPDLSTFAALEMLILDGCRDLVKIDPSIGNLTSLRVLDISNCPSITELPDAIGNLEKLEEINASNCYKLVRLDPWIGNLTSLRVLDISLCEFITELPDAIGNLEKLEELHASDCQKLEGAFPDIIRRLSSLRILDLHGTCIDSLPESICELTRLETFDVSFGELQSLPELPSSLTRLCASCKSMKAFPSLSKLESLRVYSCHSLVEIPTDIGKLSELKILILLDTSISTLPAEIGDLPWLKTLSIRSRELQSIQGLPSSLIYLSISSSRSMERLPDLSNLKNLSTLFVRRWSKLMHIKCFGKIESLTSLTVIKCKKLAEVDGLENYESLRYLTTKGCKSLYRLSDLSNLGMLKNLDLSDCRKLAKVEGLSFLKSLEVLNMSFCTSLDILDLSNLGMLKNLDLSRCRKLAKVEGLSFLKSLEVLNMSFCTSLEGILDLSNLGILKNLDLSNCRKLAKVQGLSFLKSLKVLNMSFCTSLEGILDLSNLGMLKNLDLSNCQKLAKVQGLSFLKSLEVLNMSFCTSLEGILDLSNLKELMALKLHGWKNLNVFGGFEELESLVALDISYCKIEKSPDLSNLKRLRLLHISRSSKLIENPLDLPNTIIIYEDSYWTSRFEPSENEEEDASHGGSDGSGYYNDSGEHSDCEYEEYP